MSHENINIILLINFHQQKLRNYNLRLKIPMSRHNLPGVINNGIGLSGVQFGCEAGVRFVHHEYDYRLNWMTQCPVAS